MIANPHELATQRELTRAFLDADFVTLTLIPRIRQKTTTGGLEYVEQPPRAAQRFKVIENNSRARVDNRVPGGEQAEEDFTLLGLWDAVIAPHDVFDLNGSRWEVIALEWDNGYERRATVRRYGR